MKQLILCTALFISTSTAAQIVNHIDLKADTTIRYIQVKVFSPWFVTGNIRLEVDYGQKYSGVKDDKVMDKAGNILTFNSAMHILNYFTANGWDLVINQEIPSDSSNAENRFLMKKK